MCQTSEVARFSLKLDSNLMKIDTCLVTLSLMDTCLSVK